MLIRVYCLMIAVELNELEAEPELVARIIALEDETKAVPLADRPPAWVIAMRAAWRSLRSEADAAARKYQIIAPSAVPTLYERRRRAMQSHT